MPEFVDEPKSRVKSAIEAIKLLDAIETQVTQVELEIKEEKQMKRMAPIRNTELDKALKSSVFKIDDFDTTALLSIPTNYSTSEQKIKQSQILYVAP